MFRRMRINTQERAISGDINRLQSFAAKGFNEAMRHMLLIQTSDDDLNLYAEPSTVTSPLTAEILRGLCVRPAIGSLNLLVDSGTIFVIDPTSIGADDSICVPVESGGVTIPGALAMTGNASGSVRIDVIECRLNPVPITATDNRDIFDPTTGLFTAATVTKEIEQQLEFRVRAGTPGSGFPGAASGWLPLAVAYVPNGATDNDAITFWDVRPMAEDRAVAPFNVDRFSERVSFDGLLDRSSSTVWTLSGLFRGTYKGRRVGGLIRRGSPGTDADSVNLYETENKEGAIAEPLSTTANYYIYLMFPFSLPRWARYTDASSGSRRPRNPKGIPILSAVAPNVYGNPSSTISLAAIFAGATSSDGVFIGLTKNATSNQCASVFFNGKSASLGDTAPFSYSVANASTLSYSIPADRIPPNAKFALVRVTVSHSLAATTAIDQAMIIRTAIDGVVSSSGSQPRNALVYGGLTALANPTGGAVLRTMTTPTIRVPLPATVPGTPPAPVVFNVYVGVSTPDANQMTVDGWEF